MLTALQKKIRLSKIVIWLFAFILLARLFWLALNDGLGANPIEFIEHSTGIWTLVFLMLTLSITPLSLLFKLAWMLALRRLLGLWMFAYASIHLLSYIWLDFSFEWADLYKDIIKHPYVIVGALAYIITLMLALTSNRYAIKYLKQQWKPLHQFIYLIAVLVLLHFWWLVKKDVSEPMVYASVFIVLMLIRLLKYKHHLKSLSTLLLGRFEKYLPGE